MVAILLLATAILAFFHHSKSLFPFLRSTCLGLGGILLVGIVLIMGWGFYADAATESGMGEPIAWTQGVIPRALTGDSKGIPLTRFF
jgi:hypothetical protein